MDRRLLKKFKTSNYYTVYYQKDASNLLAHLSDLHGSDKGTLRTTGHPYPWPPHHYTDFYKNTFGHCRNVIFKVFECGLGTNNTDIPSNMGKHGKPGASLRAWKEYFPNAEIYGADIDKETLFTEERIKTFYVDQTSKPSIESMWKMIGVHDFDLMIDDGLHTYEAGIILFENSIIHLKPEGHYVIEDVALEDLSKYEAYFSGKPFKVRYVYFSQPQSVSTNSLVVIGF